MLKRMGDGGGDDARLVHHPSFHCRQERRKEEERNASAAPLGFSTSHVFSESHFSDSLKNKRIIPRQLSA